MLRSERGGKRAAAKTMMRWSSAGERRVEARLGSVSGPFGFCGSVTERLAASRMRSAVLIEDVRRQWAASRGMSVRGYRRPPSIPSGWHFATDVCGTAIELIMRSSLNGRVASEPGKRTHGPPSTECR